MTRGERVIRAAVLVFSIGAAGIACADRDDSIDASATESVAVVDDLQSGSAASPQHVASNRDPFAAYGVTENAAAATITETPVWLVNLSSRPLIVTGRGGAASVVLDTVAALDSVLVDIQTRARTLELSARTPEGVAMGTQVLSMDSKPGRAAFSQ